MCNYKKFVVILMIIIMIVVLAGCNKTIIDLTYKFDRAIIKLPNGEVIEGQISNWTDYEDGDQIQVKINSKTYLVHSSNIVLISE